MKTKWSLFPWTEAEQVCQAIMAGNRGGRQPNDWQQKPDLFDDCFDAAIRHLAARRNGAIVDTEGVGHLAQAAARILFMMWSDNNGGGK